MSALNQERLLKVLLAPVVSEKSTFVGEKANLALGTAQLQQLQHQLEALEQAWA